MRSIEIDKPSVAVAKVLRLQRRWKPALFSLALLAMVGCHHSSKKCEVDGNCVDYPSTGTAGFYTTCWSAWQDGPVGCVPAWVPDPSMAEEIAVPHHVGGFTPLDDEVIPSVPELDKDAGELEDEAEMEEKVDEPIEDEPIEDEVIEDEAIEDEVIEDAAARLPIDHLSSLKNKALPVKLIARHVDAKSTHPHSVGGFSNPEDGAFSMIERLPK